MQINSLTTALLLFRREGVDIVEDKNVINPFWSWSAEDLVWKDKFLDFKAEGLIAFVDSDWVGNWRSSFAIIFVSNSGEKLIQYWLEFVGKKGGPSYYRLFKAYLNDWEISQFQNKKSIDFDVAEELSAFLFKNSEVFNQFCDTQHREIICTY